MVGHGNKIKRRQIVGRSNQDASHSEKRHVARYYGNKKRISGRNERSLRQFSIVAVCVSVLAVVFVMTRSRDIGQKWTHLRPIESVTESRNTFVYRRFPKYGTEEFVQQCNWTLYSGPPQRDCTIYVRPNAPTDGISQWFSDVVKAFFQAKLGGCNLRADYGPGINVQAVLTPPTEHYFGSAGHLPMNWTVPSGIVNASWRRFRTISYVGRILIPKYRFAYKSGRYWLNKSAYMDLEDALPGFQLETGMACSLGTLFSLSASASQFEPELFSRILPALQDETTLTLALYIRTGDTETMAQRERGKGGNLPAPSQKLQSDSTVKCALVLERQFLEEQDIAAGPAYSRVIWMVLTDSQGIKAWVREKYSGQLVNFVNRSSNEHGKVKREIMTTSSHGVHTRTSRDPSTADFAEALIDWYLIGESDLVVANGPSFAATGALRTARPYFDLNDCSQKQSVHY